MGTRGRWIAIAVQLFELDMAALDEGAVWGKDGMNSSPCSRPPTLTFYDLLLQYYFGVQHNLHASTLARSPMYFLPGPCLCIPATLSACRSEVGAQLDPYSSAIRALSTVVHGPSARSAASPDMASTMTHGNPSRWSDKVEWWPRLSFRPRRSSLVWHETSRSEI